MVILCVCLNPALDVTYRVPALVYGASHRVDGIGQSAGGKAINVARVLHQLGEPALATGLLGGVSGEAVLTGLEREGVAADFTAVAGESRRSLTIYDGQDATVFNEPGPAILADEWREFCASYLRLLERSAVVVLAGSHPPGVPLDAYGVLTEMAVSSGAKVVLDATGAALSAGLAARPHLVKPNVVELAELVGRSLESVDDVVAACWELIERGSRAVLVSRGAKGVVAVSPDGVFLVRPPEQVSGNPTGAGDALAAAVAAGMRRSDDWRTWLGHGVAVSAASVAVSVAGAIDADLADRLLPGVEIEEIL